MARRKIPRALQEEVRQRAKFLCEYCHYQERWQIVRFQIHHIVPVSKGGDDDENNLALTCTICNLGLSDYSYASDNATGQIVSLFNPRVDKWSEHFIWSNDGTQLIGKTAIGRATIDLIRMNRERVVGVRYEDVLIGRHPPDDDPRIV